MTSYRQILEDADDYKAFEAGITADYDAQSAVERELVLRLASILWRLRRATAMETGLFEICVTIGKIADHLRIIVMLFMQCFDELTLTVT